MNGSMNSQVIPRLAPTQNPSSSASTLQTSARTTFPSQHDRTNSSARQSQQTISTTEKRWVDSYGQSASRRGSQTVASAQTSKVNGQINPAGTEPFQDESGLPRAAEGGEQIQPSSALIDQKIDRDSKLDIPLPFPPRPDSKSKHRRAATSNTLASGSGQWDIQPQNGSLVSEAPLCAPRFTEKSKWPM